MNNPYQEIRKLDLFAMVSPEIMIYPFLGRKRACPTGEWYVTITHEGIKKEGERKKWSLDERRAVAGFISALESFMEAGREKGGILYVRKLPVVQKMFAYYGLCTKSPVCDAEEWRGICLDCDYCQKGTIDRPDLYAVYSRMVISKRNA